MKLRNLIYTIAAILCSLQLYGQELQIGCVAGDCQNGKGRLRFENGDEFIGEFWKGKPNGRGAYYYKNGNVYKGQFKDALMEGLGTFVWVNGDVYKGEYRSGQRYGEGKYTYSNGKVKEGIWAKGKLIHEKSAPLIVSEEDMGDTERVASASADWASVVQYFRPIENVVKDEARTALVIGNSSYTKKALKNPVNDAQSMTEELRRSGFEVMLCTDLTQKEMKLAIRDFGDTLKQRGGIGLFFYAGHGLQSSGRNYLVPVGANIKRAGDIEFESVDLGRLLVELEYAENAMNIIILDACRDNPYKEEFKGSKYNSHNGLATIGSAPYNSFIAFSTAPGFIAVDGLGDNGLYTQELLRAMKNKNTPLEQVFKNVRKNVRKKSVGKQIPWESSSVEDDFFFKAIK